MTVCLFSKKKNDRSISIFTRVQFSKRFFFFLVIQSVCRGRRRRAFVSTGFRFFFHLLPPWLSPDLTGTRQTSFSAVVPLSARPFNTARVNTPPKWRNSLNYFCRNFDWNPSPPRCLLATLVVRKRSATIVIVLRVREPNARARVCAKLKLTRRGTLDGGTSDAHQPYVYRNTECVHSGRARARSSELF